VDMPTLKRVGREPAEICRNGYAASVLTVIKEITKHYATTGGISSYRPEVAY